MGSMAASGNNPLVIQGSIWQHANRDTRNGGLDEREVNSLVVLRILWAG